MGNTLKTAFLLTLLTVLLVLIGEHFGGRDGLILGFLFAAGMNFFTVLLLRQDCSEDVPRAAGDAGAVAARV